MPTIEVTEEQHERLETLRKEIAEAFVGSYGTVRVQDAVDYLLDNHEPVGDVVAAHGGETAVTQSTDGESGPVDGPASADEEAVDDEASNEAGDGEADDGETEDDEASDDGTGDTGAEAGSGADRLSAMMSLLEDHDEKWRETDADDGNYEVDLPEGETEVVRTKDDVRAALFEHY